MQELEYVAEFFRLARNEKNPEVSAWMKDLARAIEGRERAELEFEHVMRNAPEPYKGEMIKLLEDARENRP